MLEASEEVGNSRMKRIIGACSEAFAFVKSSAERQIPEFAKRTFVINWT